MIYKHLYDIFRGRTDVYAECYWDAKKKKYGYKSIKSKLTLEIFKKHCTNAKYLGIGVYPIIQEDMTQFIVADFDFHSDYEATEAKKTFKDLYAVSQDIEWTIYFETSKSGKGFHVYIFFSSPVKAWKARKFMMALLEKGGASHLSSMDRLFPSQDRIYSSGKSYGNLIHLPFSARFIKHGTFFVDQKGSKYTNAPDDLELFVENLIRHTPEQLDSMLDTLGLTKEIDPSLEYETDDTDYEYADDAVAKIMEDPFIKWCRENPSEVDYHAWFAMITNLLPLGDEGVKMIHSISQMDVKRYDRKATQNTIINCQGYSPVTYNWIVNNTKYTDRKAVRYKSPIVSAVSYSKVVAPIKEKLGHYYQVVGKNDRELSNFLIVPVAHVRIEDSQNKIHIERLIDIKTHRRIIKSIPVTAKMISSLDAFQELIMGLSHEAFFYGSKTSLMYVFDYLNQTYPSIPVITGKSAIGLHKNKKSGQWSCLTQSSAWDSIGPLNDLVYYNPSYEKKIVYTSQATITSQEVQNINEHLYTFNGLSQISSILGWMFSLPIKQRLFKTKNLRFPVLMIHGQAGSGKTETMRHIIKRFYGDQGNLYVVGDQTNFTYLNLFGSSNTFPIYLDEYKPQSFSFSTKKLISQLIRGVYDNSTASRGQKDMTVREYPIIAPAVICGEAGFTEPALMERAIDVFMSKEESKPCLQSFLSLKKLPLTKFGNAYLNWTLRLSDEQLLEIYNSELDDKHDRPSHNIAMMSVGLTLYKMYTESLGLSLNVEALKEEMTKTQIKSVKEFGDTASVVDHILEGIYTMKDLGLLNSEMIVNTGHPLNSALYLRGIYPQFKKWARETDFEYEIIPFSELRKQIQKMEYFKENRNVRFNDKVKKAFVLDIEKLKEKHIFSDVERDKNELPN